MIETYKMTSGGYDPHIPPPLSLYKDRVDEPSKLRGHTKKLFKRRSRLCVRTKFFGNRVVGHWNDLPETVVQAPSINSFKNRLDRAWSRQDILYKYDQKITKTNIGTGSEDMDEDLDIEA
jgi:hypothetical protein